MEQVQLAAPVLKKNDEFAAENRAWFAARGWTVVNLMSAPGAGKTTLLERTLPLLASRRTDHSWHGHSRYAGERRMVQLNYLDSRPLAMLQQRAARFATHFMKDVLRLR